MTALSRTSDQPRKAPKVKARKCANRKCRAEFVPCRPMQTACSPNCAVEIAAKKRELVDYEEKKAERKELKAKKEQVKRPKTLKAEAQAAFNAFIRYRDLSAGHNCICCGKPFEPQKPGGSVDAGHYLSRGGAPHLAFNENNCFAQRKNCNRPGGTTAAAFRLGVKARIGIAALEALEADQEQRRYRPDDYRRIRDEYRAKLRELKGKA